jgi:hypothetical protein
VLCAAVSLCPTLSVNRDQFPDCGFRVQGDVLDLECVCNGEICPMGVATSCAQAQQLMSTQTELSVCSQVSEGRCTGGTPAPPSSSGTSGTCDHQCQAQCGGDPSCYQMCGC